jgi:hypothetical protein
MEGKVSVQIKKILANPDSKGGGGFILPFWYLN